MEKNDNEKLKAQNKAYRNEISQLRTKLLLVENDLKIYQNSMSYRIGRLITLSLEHPIRLFSLPFALLKLIFSEMKKNKRPKVKKIKNQPLIPMVNPSPIQAKQFVTVDVIVCVHNALEDVKECLNSLYDTLSIPFQLLIVDDGSEKPTKSFLEEFSNSHSNKLFRNEEAKGYTIAANIGLRSSTADYVILLNSDTVVTDGWLEKMIQCMEVEKTTGIVGPLSNAASWQTVPEVMENGDWKVNQLPESINLALMSQIVEEASVKEYPIVPFVNGFCLMISRKVLLKIGLLDEETFPKGYGEENDYCIRAMQAGFTLRVADDTYIFHEKSKSFSHEVRKELSPKASGLLRAKHSDVLVNKYLQQIKQDVTFERIRLRIINVLQLLSHFNLLNHQSIAFVLNARGGGGGANSVVQETRGLRRLGLDVKIINTLGNKHAFISFYPDCEDFTLFAKSKEDIPIRLQDFHYAISTVYHTVKCVEQAIKLNPNLVPLYYIQDDETLFFDKESPQYQEAKASYRLIKQNTYFAKTNWLIHGLSAQHAIEIVKVKPSIDTKAYNPFIKISKPTGQSITISAMIRPNTPRRSPYETLELMRHLKQKYQDKVNLLFFGCDDEAIQSLNTKLDFSYKNYGILPMGRVRELLMESDIFIDYSTYQAFGRTGIEAMASGCVPILPIYGGTSEFAINGYNSILIDTSSVEENYGKIYELIENANYLYLLKIRGLETAKNYNIRNSAFSELLMFYKFVDQQDESRVRIGYKYSEKANRCPTGTAYLRILNPINALIKKKPTIQAIRITDNTIGHINLSILFTHRLAISSQQISDLKKKGVKVVYDIDDNIFASHVELHDILRNVSTIIVTNPYLYHMVESYNKQIQIIPNYLDQELWFNFNRDIFHIQSFNKDKNFIFLGTPTHKDNLEKIKTAIIEFKNKYHYQFLTNFKTDYSENLPIPVDNYPNYIKCAYKYMQDVEFGIAVLDLNDFNYGKSYLKYLEYTALGIPGIYSSGGELDFDHVIADHINGLQVKDNQNWDTELSEMKDKTLQIELRKNAFYNIQKFHTLDKGIDEWMKIIES